VFLRFFDEEKTFFGLAHHLNGGKENKSSPPPKYKPLSFVISPNILKFAYAIFKKRF